MGSLYYFRFGSVYLPHDITTNRVITDISIQREIPKAMGLAPTAFIAPSDRELPIRNNVMERNLCDATVITSDTV